MAKFKYTGPTMKVGRFGLLKKGDVVDLWQSEADYVSRYDQENWKDVSKQDTDGVGVIIPVKTSPYDLTRINWLMEGRASLKRMSRGELGDVAKAMRLIGCKLPSEEEARTFSREHLFEVLYGEATRLRWMTLASTVPQQGVEHSDEDEDEGNEPEDSEPQEADAAEEVADEEPATEESGGKKIKRVVRQRK